MTILRSAQTKDVISTTFSLDEVGFAAIAVTPILLGVTSAMEVWPIINGLIMKKVVSIFHARAGADRVVDRAADDGDDGAWF